MRTFGSPVRTLFAKAFAAFFALSSQSLRFLSSSRVMLKERSITRTMSVFFVVSVGCSPVTLMVIFAIPAFSSTHCADFSSFGPVVFSLIFVLTPVSAIGGSTSAASADIGRTLTSISTASTMLKMRFFIFFFPPVILFFSKNFTRFNHLRLAVYHYTRTFPECKYLNIRRSGLKFRSFQVFR